jgi:hypothetical protein
MISLYCEDHFENAIAISGTITPVLKRASAESL